MSSKQYKLIIFDWDGTIMDSIGKIVNCIKYSAESLSIAPPSDIAIKNIIGPVSYTHLTLPTNREV